MIIGWIALIALGVGTSAVQTNNTAVRDLKGKLEDIKDAVQSMKPTIQALGLYVDSLLSNQANQVLLSVGDIHERLLDTDIPEDCRQKATEQLNELQTTQKLNCSVVLIFEDAGQITYKTADFVATAMSYIDDVRRGTSECQPWYKVWKSIPCFIRYLFHNIFHLKTVTQKAFTTFKTDRAKVNNIIDQVRCTSSQMFAQSKTTADILNDAYQCSKKTQ